MDTRKLRWGVQGGIALLLLYVGWQYVRWVSHFRYGTPYVPRPAGVEAFLPISALVALKAWIATGVFTRVHPAALVILLAVLGSAVVFHRGVCSWVCPIGLLEEALGRLGIRIADRKIEPPKYVDWALRSIKYLLLAFFIKVVFIDFSGTAALAFLSSPYNKVAAVKMLEFWLSLGPTAIAVLGVLGVASLVVQNAWCRYLCPYGALLSLIGFLSPATVDVSRDPSACDDCGLCTTACPNYVDVQSADTVDSLECTRCSECLRACPRSALTYSLGPLDVKPRSVGIALVAAIFLIIGLAMVTGHWHSALTYHDWARLVPAADRISHTPY
ncbi:MAG: 4Fe-4S binding protein [Halodesulfurarchaeum sp.]